VNGADWEFSDLDASQIAQLIDRALEFVDISITRAEEIFIGDDFQSRPMHGQLSIWDLFSPHSPLQLPRELWQELTGWLGRARCYVDLDQWPEGFDDALVSINGAAAVENFDVAWAHCCTLGRTPAACFSLRENLVAQTTTSAGSAVVHFVAEDAHRRLFWRDTIVEQGDSLESLIQYAPHAYPNLYFVEGTLEHAGRLSGGYVASRARVKGALAALDDWGLWAFTCPPPALRPGEEQLQEPNAAPDNRIIQARFTAFGIVAAPENPDVYRHRASREARETKLGDRTLYCEWHVKLELHRNRIHFHPPVPESDNKVVVGMIHEHLPLP
jgi:hypothetical protein